MGPSHRPPTDLPARLLTVVEAAAILHLSPRTLRRMIDSGELSVVRFGRRTVRIRAETVASLIEQSIRNGSIAWDELRKSDYS